MSKQHICIGALVLGLASALPSPLYAQGRGHGRGHGNAEHSQKAHEKAHEDAKATTGRAAPAPRTVVIDREGHARVIREFAAAGPLPPGLAKRQELPPGLRKQLRENGALPPGLQKRLTPVPRTLVARLPAVPPYYARYFAGNDLVVVDTRTNRVAAIIPNVWR